MLTPCAAPWILPRSAAMATANASHARHCGCEHEAMEGLNAVQVARRSTVHIGCRQSSRVITAVGGQAELATRRRMVRAVAVSGDLWCGCSSVTHAGEPANAKKIS